jgi:hypothetical protein
LVGLNRLEKPILAIKSYGSADVLSGHNSVYMVVHCFQAALPHLKSASVFLTGSAFYGFEWGEKAGLDVLEMTTMFCTRKSLNW